MLNYDYTLRDKLFRYALRKSAESQMNISQRLLITGGAATQLFLKGSTEFYRPTDDIDLIAESYVSKNEKIAWLIGLSEVIKTDGFANKK